MYVPIVSAFDFYDLSGEAEIYDDARGVLMNPWKDSFLDNLHGIMLGCLSGIEARPPNMMSSYWMHMDADSELMAAGEAVALLAIYQNLYEVQRNYIAATYLPYVDLMEVDSPEFPKYAKSLRAAGQALNHQATASMRMALDEGRHALTPRELQPYLIGFAVPNQLVTPKTLAGNEYIRAMLEGRDADKPLIRRPKDDVTAEMTSRAAKKWREDEYPVQQALSRSFDSFREDIVEARKIGNSLTGPAARNRTLIVNHDIPLVTEFSFFQWWALCGIEAFQHGSTDYFSFTHPHLPVTKDNSVGGGQSMQTDDSHANHSLPGRSGGNMRTASGRIIHGIHKMWAYDGKGYPWHDVIVENSMMTRPGALIRQDLPAHFTKAARINPSIFWRKADNLIVSIQDPWTNQGGYLCTDWIQDYPISTSMRSISKDWNLHFMFTSDEWGLTTLNLWKESMLHWAVIWAERMTQPEWKLHLNAMCAKQIAESREPAKPTKAAAGKRFKFDLSGLNGI